ncbi:MAG TPA: hypothetical protein VFS24_12515, partial [Steroidobacteraceae bacterium]|nr:hypothetical protein [Steroidobacteraceae bacterium]
MKWWAWQEYSAHPCAPPRWGQHAPKFGRVVQIAPGDLVEPKEALRLRLPGQRVSATDRNLQLIETGRVGDG